MTYLMESLTPAAAWLLRASLEASVLVVLVLAVQRAFQQYLPARWRYALWTLVLIRLVMPASLPSAWSISNALTLIGSKSSATAFAPTPAAPMPIATAKPNAPEWNVSYGPVPNSSDSDIATSHSTDAANADATASQVSSSHLTAGRSQTWLNILPQWAIHIAAALWLAVAGSLLLRVIVGSILASRRLRAAAPCEDARALALLSQCKAQAGVRANVTLAETSAVDTPALAGVFRPRLLMPLGLAGSLSDKELTFVFLHELAHLRRRDVALNWLTSVLETLHWFNPLIWLAGARMRTDRELACDAMVLTWTGQLQRCDYGQTLLKLMQSIPTHAATAGAVGIVEDNRQFARRITMISRFETSPKWSVLGLILVTLLALVGLTSAADQSDKPAEKAAAVTKTVTKIDATSPSTQPATLKAISDDEIRKALHKKINVEFTDIPFTDAVGFLREISSINIVLNRQALHAYGIEEKGLKANIKLKDVTLDKAIDVLLDEVGQTLKMKYMVDDGLIIISTAEELAQPRMPVIIKDENLAKSLRRTVNKVDMAEIPLSQAIDFIREISGENIHVKWAFLEQAGISKAQPLNLRASGISMSRCLRLVLESSGPAKLAILADRGVITISTAEDLASQTETAAAPANTAGGVSFTFTVPPAPSPKPEDMVLKIYDVRDLVTPVSIDPVKGQPVNSDANQTGRLSMKDLVSLIQNSVAKESWQAQIGGSIRQQETQLLVTNSPAAHDAIAKFLEQLRAIKNQQLLCEIKLIRMPKAELEKLGVALLGKSPSVITPAGSAFAVLDANHGAELLATLQANKDAEVLAAPRLTTFNGQKAYLSVGRETAFVTDYKKTTDANGVTVYTPVVTTLFKGTTINLQGVIGKERGLIELFIKPSLMGFKEPVEETPFAAAPDGKKLTVQKPQVENSELQSTIFTPSDATVALFGLKSPSWMDAKEAESAYLILVKASVLKPDDK